MLNVPSAYMGVAQRRCRVDPLCRGLDILVREMGVTQGHSYVAVTEQSRDDRHRYAVHEGVTGHRVPPISRKT